MGDKIEIDQKTYNMLMSTFESIVSGCERMTSGNVAHQAPNVRVMAVNGMVILKRLKGEM